MPPAWWHDVQCFARIGATSWYQVARATGSGSVIGSPSVQAAAASARPTIEQRKGRMGESPSNQHTGAHVRIGVGDSGSPWGIAAARPALARPPVVLRGS